MNEGRLKSQLEIIWWGFTAIVVLAVLLPIWLQTHDFPFYLENMAFIVIAITFTRYAFLLRHTFIARMLWPKLFILAISAILIFILIMALGDFTNFLDEKGLQLLVDHLPIQKQYRVMKYIQGEMTFFGVASVFSAFLLALRMLVSIWRIRNRGTV
jgi:hypothetical protein